MSKQKKSTKDLGVLSHTNVQGAHAPVFSGDGVSLAMGWKAIDAKATRWVCGSRYGIHGDDLEALSIVWCWLELNGKQEIGAPQAVIVDWSGKRYRWKRKVNNSIAACIKAEAIERVAFQHGFRLRITQKGLYVLRHWQERISELHATMLQERAKL